MERGECGSHCLQNGTQVLACLFVLALYWSNDMFLATLMTKTALIAMYIC